MRRAQLRARRQTDGSHRKSLWSGRAVARPAAPPESPGQMRVAVIDVGSNTARLLVADVDADGSVVPVAEERSYLRLGAEIERTGTLGAKKIAAAAATLRRLRPPRDGARRRPLDGDRHRAGPPGRLGRGTDGRARRGNRPPGPRPRPPAARADSPTTAPSRGRPDELPRGRRGRRRRRRLDRDRRRHAAARRRLDPVRRPRFAAPHARAPARRSADRPRRSRPQPPPSQRRSTV